MAKTNAGAMVGSLIGMAAGSYIGLPLLFPLVGAFIAGFAIHRFGGGLQARPYAASIALQAGHVSWMILGAAIGSLWAEVAIDVVVMGVGLLWLYLRPGLAPVVVLCAWHAIGLFVNVSTLFGVGFGADVHKSLLSHILFRVGAIVLMLYSFLSLRNKPGVIGRLTTPRR
jgi:hypothetical protein